MNKLMVSSKLILLTFLCISGSFPLFAKDKRQRVVVFDTTNTVFRVNQDKIAASVKGLKAGIWYAFTHKTVDPAKLIEEDFRNLVDSFGQQVTDDPAQLVRGQDGLPLADLFVRWLRGLVSPVQAVGLLNGRATESILKRIAETVFDSSILAANALLIPAVVDLAQSIKGQGVEIYLIGNWDPSSFALMEKDPRNGPFFACVPADHRFISGTTGLIMPCDTAGFLGRVAGHAGVKCADICFISGMSYHRIAAQKAGVEKTYAVELVGYEQVGAALAQDVNVTK